MVDQIMVKVEEAGKLCGIGRSKMYELVRTGVVPSVKIGKSVRIRVTDLRHWTEALGEQSEASSK